MAKKFFSFRRRPTSSEVARMKNAQEKGIKPPKTIPKHYTKPKGYAYAKNEQSKVRGMALFSQ